ncbi:MAG: hypothetical protein RSA91_05440 [Bacilli bacterium]
METTNLSKIKRDKMLNTINEIKNRMDDEKLISSLADIENDK